MKRLLTLLALVLCSCAETFVGEEIARSNNENLPDLTAAFAEEDATRTYIEDGKYLRWNEDDRLTIFFGNTLNRQYKFNGQTGDNSGTFSLVADGMLGTGNAFDHIYALYPYNADARITDEGVISLTLPAVQNYAENSFGRGANTMVAVTENLEDTFLAFKNVGGYLKLKLYNAEGATIKSIEVKGNNGEKLAGEATLSINFGEAPTLTMAESATDAITLDCGEGVALGTTAETATEFWVVLPATTFAEGLTITATDTEGKAFKKSTTKEVIIERNAIQPMAALEAKFIAPQPANNEIWYTSTDGEVVMPNATDVFGANIVSNTHENGKGIIKFDAPVTSIGDYAFSDCSNLTSVTIPDSITSIGTFAFKNCSSLTSIIIPDSVTEIGEQAFLSCSSLTSITIPNSITSIGIYTFKYCSSLTSVTIPDSITSIGDYAFACCSSLKAFYGKFASADNRCLIIDGVLNSFAPAGLTEYVIPDSVTSIGGQAFLECSNLKSVTIPNSVTSIREYAFRNCSSLTSVTIPDSVTSIGERAFQYCSNLASVTIGNSVTSIVNDAFAGCTSLTSVTIPDSVTEIGNAIFWHCSSLTSITIPDSITSIGVQAFDGCSSLTSVTIPDSVTSIGRAAFASCSSLTSVTIPDSVTSIGRDAFRNCSSLTSVTIPDSVTSIERAAFDVCSSLTSVYCKPTTPPVGGQYMFDQSASGRKIYVPYNSVDAYKSSENWSRYASDIVGYDFATNEIYEQRLLYTSTDGKIVTPYTTNAFSANIVSNTYENGVGIIKFDAPITSIGEDAFYKCKSLASVTIPEGVTWIGARIFQNCSNLASVTIPNSLTWIGADAFYGCSSLTSVYISDIVAWCYRYYQSYSSNPLYYAHNLYLNNKLVTDLIIPDSATAISQYAFINCSNLTSITIGKGVGSIETAAFAYCTGKLIINSRKIVEGSYLQYGYPSSENGWLSGAMFTSVTIGNGITKIGEYVFYKCSSLTSVTICDSVTSIGYRAFGDCSSLTGVYISDIAAWCNISFELGENPLLYARNLYLNNKLVTNLAIPDSVTTIRKYAFINCTSLKSVTIPNSVTTIGAAAFECCRKLTSVTIPNSVTTIGQSSFNCTGLKSVTIPNSVTTILAGTFQGCSNLTNVTIPNSVTSIGDSAFKDCSSLNSVTIPESVTLIEDDAFRNCSSLTSVYCKPTTPPSLGTGALATNTDSGELYIYVPTASYWTYKKASSWSSRNILSYDF